MSLIVTEEINQYADVLLLHYNSITNALALLMKLKPMTWIHWVYTYVYPALICDLYSHLSPSAVC